MPFAVKIIGIAMISDTMFSPIRSRHQRLDSKRFLSSAVRRVVRLFVGACIGLAGARAQIPRFDHIVVVVQENRTPDNLFQGLCAPPYGSAASCSTTPSSSQYNIQTKNWLDKTSRAGVTQPRARPLANEYDLSHNHDAFVVMCDSGTVGSGPCKMDGAANIGCGPNCPHTRSSSM
jgi:hypothetical protein